MITDNELRIANTSYINKDFAKIYPELLDIFKSLTSKYDPTTSNESDPGVVLLKLLGFIGDKLNYNVDKNVLECFAPSATQESSMRRILSPLGYEMGYYHGATTDVQFTYQGDALGTSGSFVLGKYGTVVTDDSGSTQFVLLEPAVINKKGSPVSVKAIQGRKDTLTSGDSDVLLLEDLDSNNRMYFPVPKVAENGVWVRNSNDDNNTWSEESNLNTQTPGSLCYRFGYDSARGLPYVEFPSDIASIIGGGLKIDYIVCDGVDGNVRAGMLTTLASPTSDIPVKGSEVSTVSFEDGSGADLLTIRNISAAVDGADPETLDEAYSNFKKTVGTFDTLVTCRDYANAIYNMRNATTGDPVVSNCRVTDRRDDLIHSTRVVSYDEYGQMETNVSNYLTKNAQANNLFLYPLKPLAAYTPSAYADSFRPLTSLSYIKNELEGSKLASHDYSELDASDVHCLKNYLTIKARLSTTYKVNSYERTEILGNVVSALIKKFNAREVDYGQEIPYDSILSAIEGADERISSVSLDEPTLRTTVLLSQERDFGGTVTDEVNLLSSEGLNFLLTILARNILAGRVSLFDYDDDFGYEFGQSQYYKDEDEADDSSSTNIPMKIDSLKSIESGVNITLSPNSTNPAEYLLQENEVVQVVAPSLITEVTYTAYTYYNLKLNKLIPANENYKLKSGEALTIHYTDSTTSSVVTKEYGEGTIIYSNLPLSNTTAGLDGVVTKTINGDSMLFAHLGAADSIEIRHLNEKTFSDNTYFYWIRNNDENKLFPDASSTTTMLGDGEYVFYTDSGFTSLTTLGSGTTIIAEGLTDAKMLTAERITYADISASGLLSLTDKWRLITLSENAKLTIRENAILTLTSGDILRLTTLKEDATVIPLTNAFVEISEDVGIEYKSGSAEFVPWDQYDSAIAKPKIRSRLDMDCGKDSPQTLGDSQTITLNTADDNVCYTLSKGASLRLSSTVQEAGGTIDVSSMSAYVYKTDDSLQGKSRDANGYLTFQLNATTTSQSMSVPNIPDEYKALMVYVVSSDEGVVTVRDSTSTEDGTANTDGIQWLNPNSGDTTSSSLTLKSGLNNILIAPKVTKLTFTYNGNSSASITLDYLRYLKKGDSGSSYALNPQLGITSALAASTGEKNVSAITESLLTKLRSLDAGGEVTGISEDSQKFYYTCRIDNSKAIEADDLTSPEALYDANNVACKATISEIDISSLDIDVVRSSRL